jgi:hypothetical protein
MARSAGSDVGQVSDVVSDGFADASFTSRPMESYK